MYRQVSTTPLHVHGTRLPAGTGWHKLLIQTAGLGKRNQLLKHKKY